MKSMIIFPILSPFFSAPSEAPHLVTVYNSSSTSLVVRWSLLPEKHFQGKPIGYKIWCYSDESENDKKVVRLDYTTSTTTLKNLTVYTMYFIKVSAVSSGGIGPAKIVKARTDAEGTARFPENRILVMICQVTTIIPISYRKLEGYSLLLSIDGNRFISRPSLISKTLFENIMELTYSVSTISLHVMNFHG